MSRRDKRTPSVFVTSTKRTIVGFFSECLDALKRSASVKLNPYDRRITSSEISEEITGCDAVLLGTQPFGSEQMDAAPHLEVISRLGVGYDNVDVPAATQRGIWVTITGTANSDSVADLAVGLMIAVARRITIADQNVRLGRWRENGRLVGTSVHGKTIGIVGLGRIGSRVARRVKGFDMRVLYSDVQPKPGLEVALGLEAVPLDDLLARSDFVSLHVPLNEETHHLIGERELRLMRKSAYLINTSRGPVVDEKALEKALSENWISGAGLDVFYSEPINPDSPLLKHLNVVCTPHSGSSTKETYRAMGLIAARNIIRVLKGNPPIFPANKPSLVK
ncbi:phosphoglycerate dehydrogenase [Candidatus Bathyarchaeota archaeon]|nr:phosphoglycerate dehydrogenase [Candidatus Bathyarchaeota archaeon]